MQSSSKERLLDLTRDLGEMSRHATSPDHIDGIITQSLDALAAVVPYDLATVMELDRQVLTVRVARGRLSGPEVRAHRLKLDDYPSIRDVLARGRARAFHEHDHSDGDGDPFEGVLDLPDGHFCMVAPLRTHDLSYGVLTLDRSQCGNYSSEVLELVDVFGRLLALAINYGDQSVKLERMRRQLVEQNRVLVERASGPKRATELIESCDSPAMQKVVGLCKQVASSDAPVLITGETGTGKEVLAGAIHDWSRRADGPFVAVNCAALPAQLIESELFGHVKGAFTGATQPRLGRFQAANGGTLLLDEIGELPIELQSKLLRVLQDGCFEPVGSDRTVRVDVRLLAATNRSLIDRVESGDFRQDLYYRLAVFPVEVPALRERREDIRGIAHNILDRLAAKSGGGPWTLTDEDIARLEAGKWPGNVRELVNVLERATILARDGVLQFEPTALEPAPRRGATRVERFATLREMEKRHIREALDRAAGKVHGPGGAAELLGLNPSTLRSRIAKLGLTARRRADRTRARV